MAWDICITADGGPEIQAALATWDSDRLITALVDDDIERYEAMFSVFPSEGWIQEKRATYALAHDPLAEIAYDRIEHHNS